MPRHIPAILVFLTGLLATFGGWRLASAYEQDRALSQHRAAFEQQATSIFVSIEREASSEQGVVQGLAAFFASSTRVDEDEFHTYCERLERQSPGLTALEWAPQVSAEDLPAFLEQTRSPSWPDPVVRGLSEDGSLAPVEPRPVYYPVRFRYPPSTSQAVLGLDLYSEPMRRAAVEAAIRTGELATTEPLALVQGDESRIGLLAVAPLYASGKPLSTTAERQAAATGVVLGVLRADELVREALAEPSSTGSQPAPDASDAVQLLVYLAEGPPDRRPLVAKGAGSDRLELTLAQALEGPHAHHTVASLDDALLVVARPADERPPQTPAVLSSTALAAGLALTVAFTLVLRSLTVRADQVAELVDARTAELRAASRSLEESERGLRAIVDNSIDGILVVGHDGVVLSVNPVVPRIFELPAERIVGAPVSQLLPEPHRSRVQAELEGIASAAGIGIIGRISELNARRADGTIFPLELAVVELEDMGSSATLWIVRDISERRAVDQMKDRFISTVSHELRTPLASILGSLELVKDGTCGPLPAQAQRMVDLAFGNGERLLRLINDLLDLERLAGGGIGLELSRLDAGELVSDAVEANLGLAQRHRVQLGRKARQGSDFVLGDRHRLLQVFANLIGNAIRFSPPSGRVKVSAERRPGEVIFRVQDEGEGIPTEFHPYVFAPFSQADATDRRKVGGSGLGLSIAKSIVEEHGGSIWFETRRGAGTTFFFSLPVASQRPGAAPPDSTEG